MGLDITGLSANFVGVAFFIRGLVLILWVGQLFGGVAHMNIIIREEK